MKTWTRWTTWEIKTMINTMVEGAEKGIPVRDSLVYLTQILPGKTDSAISHRWYKHESKIPKVMKLLKKAKERQPAHNDDPVDVQPVEAQPIEIQAEVIADDPIELARGIVRVMERMISREKELVSEVDSLTSRIRDMEQTERDFNDMVRVMAKAREMMVGDEEAATKATFKMDQNGNLERVDH